MRVFLLCALMYPGTARSAQILWSVGKPDGTNTDYALAPDGFGRFTKDALYVVGRSSSGKDWPYVQPGPLDSWGGTREHTFSVFFTLDRTPRIGICTLRLALLDAHSVAPPILRIVVNGKVFNRQCQAGPGDACVMGDPSQGKRQTFDIRFDPSTLKQGVNEVFVRTVAGSWLVWDSLSLEADGAVLGSSVFTRAAAPLSGPYLVRRGGLLKQIVTVPVVHFGRNTAATVKVGKWETSAQLTEGNQQLEVPVPAVKRPTRYPVKVMLNGITALSTSIDLKPVRKFEVYLLAHSHVDIGYTALQSDVLKKQFANMEAAIALARKTQNYPEGSRFRWNAEVGWAVDAYLKQADKSKQAALIDAVRKGWVELDALYGSQLTALCRPEELVHLVKPSLKLARRTGKPIESAMITDVPGYTWGLIPVMAQAGVKYFSIGPNPGDRIGPTIRAWGDKPFVWVSPGGDSSVLCWMAGTGYSWFHARTLAQKGDTDMLEYLRGLTNKGYPYDMVQVRYTIHGDNGAPDPTLSDTVKAWNERYAYPRLVLATTTEMFKRFEARYGKSVPRVRGDFTPYWEDGAASTARETAVNRTTAERLTQAENLWTMLRPKEFPVKAFDEAWRNVVLYDEHTWGAINSYTAPDSDFVKGQWKVKQAFALDAQRQSNRLVGQALDKRGKAVTGAVDVFNTTSWQRTGLVTVPAAQSKSGNRVVGPDGRAVPSQRMKSGELAFLAKGVPPFGSKRFRIVPGAPLPGKASATVALLKTRAMTVALDRATGEITGVKSPFGDTSVRLNQYRYVTGREPSSAVGDENPVIRVIENGPLVAEVMVTSKAAGARSLVRRVRVVDGVDSVVIANTLDKLAIRTKEGVHFGFHLNVTNPVVRMDMPWSVIRPEADQMAGSCKNWFTVQRWVDVSNSRTGFTLTTPDAPLIEMGGITAELPWMEHIRPSSTLYSYVMNNYWHTNYKADQSGLTTFRYTLTPHGKFDAVASSQAGIESSQPLMVVPARGTGLPTPILWLSAPGVVVTSFRPSEDGKAFMIRLYGASGVTQKTQLRLHGRTPRAVFVSDLSEKSLRRVQSPITVPGWGMVTLRVER